MLCAALWLAAACQPARGDQYRLLDSDYDAAQIRVDLIQQANFQIDAAYFAVGQDALGAMYMRLLRDAARRGLRVRLLINSQTNQIPGEVQRLLVESGVQIREYHPFRLAHPGWINRRLHDKLLLIDSRQMVVGGRNLDQRFFGMSSINYIDRDAYISGDVALVAQRYFNEIWNSDDVRPSDLSPGLIKKLARFDDDSDQPDGNPRELRNPRADQAEAWLSMPWPTICCRAIECCSGRDWDACSCRVCCVRFLYDPEGRKHDPQGTAAQLIALVEQAQESVLIESPYFLLTPSLRKALLAARDRGASVTVVTNSLASTDHISVAAAYNNEKRYLLRQGIQLWEFAGPHHLHGKSVVVDDKYAVVGSYNFDPRGEHFNTELAVVIHSLCAARKLRASIERHMQDSFQIGADGLTVKTDERHPGAKFSKRVKMNVLRPFVPVARRLL